MRNVLFSVGLFFLLASSALPQVVINEIMMDPDASSDSKGEWIELYNDSDSVINIDGWILRDAGRDRHIIQAGGALDILPGNFLTLGRSADSTENGGYDPDYVYSNFILSNEEDEVVLAGAAEDVIDSVAYGFGWPFRKGASMELISPGLDNTDPASWGPAEAPFGHGDLGTPGLSNSISGLTIDDESVGYRESESALSATAYPNPTGKGVKIKFSCTDPALEGEEYVLEIFSVRGRLIARISSCCLSSGENPLYWGGCTGSGELAPAGVYLFRITAGQARTSGKVVLLR
ncbi:MAG: lamin tail domain-containing protein [Candidatus Glassbacteria bacterium]